MLLRNTPVPGSQFNNRARRVQAQMFFHAVEHASGGHLVSGKQGNLFPAKREACGKLLPGTIGMLQEKQQEPRSPAAQQYIISFFGNSTCYIRQWKGFSLQFPYRLHKHLISSANFLVMPVLL